VPLAALAAVLVIVAWQMSDLESFRHLLRGPIGDRVVLLVTFALTVAFDLTVAIEVGLVLASFLFMHRMSEVVALESQVTLQDEDSDAAGGTRPARPTARRGRGVPDLGTPVLRGRQPARRGAGPVRQAAEGVRAAHAPRADDRRERRDRAPEPVCSAASARARA
jgi:MFS superfamily sulfate permease-like transporter